MLTVILCRMAFKLSRERLTKNGILETKLPHFSRMVEFGQFGLKLGNLFKRGNSDFPLYSVAPTQFGKSV